MLAARLEVNGSAISDFKLSDLASFTISPFFFFDTTNISLSRFKYMLIYFF